MKISACLASIGITASLLTTTVSAAMAQGDPHYLVGPVVTSKLFNRSTTGIHADFFPFDPGFDAYPGYTLSVSGDVKGYAGVNWPPLHTGLLSPASGGYVGDTLGCTGSVTSRGPNWIGFVYEVPIGAPNADGGVRLVVQTTDGFYHSTTSKPKSLLLLDCAPPTYDPYLYGSVEGDYSPTITPGSASDSVNKIATVYFGTLKNHSIAWLFPAIYGSNVKADDNGGNFTYNAVPVDPFFNYQLSHPNN